MRFYASRESVELRCHDLPAFDSAIGEEGTTAIHASATTFNDDSLTEQSYLFLTAPANERMRRANGMKVRYVFDTTRAPQEEEKFDPQEN